MIMYTFYKYIIAMVIGMRALLETILNTHLQLIQSARNTVPREEKFHSIPNKIKVAIGMRRVGKTVCLYQTAQALLDNGVSQEQILFINFEDDRLLPMDAKKMGELIDTFYELYPENHQRTCYFFLDEVQVVSEWYRVIRRYHDSTRVQLYLTGSSSKLLSTEIHTSLRGRSLANEIYPFSFSEYLSFHHIKRPKKTPFGKQGFDILYQQLLHYLTIGGFPESQTLSSHHNDMMLQEYLEITLMRDVIERHAISNATVLKYLAMSVLKNSASPFSINKFFNDIKSQGYKISKETLYDYADYLEESFLCFTVPLYSESNRLRQNTPKKIYAIDHGLIRALSLQTNDLYGKLFENLIYIDLRRQYKKIFFYKTHEGFEIDFVTIDSSGKRECLQVCWDTSNPETLKREERALFAAKKEIGIPGRIITPYDYLREFAK